MDEMILYTPDLTGEVSELFPGNSEIVVLREDHAGTTLLVRFPAGGNAEEHQHFGRVQHFVVSGEYESDGRTFRAGTYRLLPEGAHVASMTSRDGAVVLIMYDPPEFGHATR